MEDSFLVYRASARLAALRRNKKQQPGLGGGNGKREKKNPAWGESCEKKENKPVISLNNKEKCDDDGWGCQSKKKEFVEAPDTREYLVGGR